MVYSREDTTPNIVPVWAYQDNPLKVYKVFPPEESCKLVWLMYSHTKKLLLFCFKMILLQSGLKLALFSLPQVPEKLSFLWKTRPKRLLVPKAVQWMTSLKKWQFESNFKRINIHRYSQREHKRIISHPNKTAKILQAHVGNIKIPFQELYTDRNNLVKLAIQVT